MGVSLDDIKERLEEINGFERLPQPAQVDIAKSLLDLEQKIIDAQRRLAQSEESLKEWSWEYALSWVPTRQTSVDTISDELMELNAQKQSLLGELSLHIGQVKRLVSLEEAYKEDDAKYRAAMVLGGIPGFYSLPKRAEQGELSQEQLIANYVEKEAMISDQAKGSEYEITKGIKRLYEQNLMLIQESTKDEINKFDPQILRGKHYLAERRMKQRVEAEIESQIEEKLEAWKRSFWIRTPGDDEILDQREAIKQEVQALRPGIEDRIWREEFSELCDAYFYGNERTPAVSEAFFDLTSEQQQIIQTKFRTMLFDMRNVDFLDDAKKGRYQKELRSLENSIADFASIRYRAEAESILKESGQFQKLKQSEQLQIINQMAESELRIRKLQGDLSIQMARSRIDPNDFAALQAKPEILRTMQEIRYYQQRQQQILTQWEISPESLKREQGFNFTRMASGALTAGVGYYFLGGAAFAFAGPVGVAALAAGGFGMGYLGQEIGQIAEHMYRNWDDIQRAYEKGQWQKIAGQIIESFPQAQPYLELVDKIRNAKDVMVIATVVDEFVHSHDAALLKTFVPDIEIYADMTKQLKQLWDKGDFRGFVSFVQDNDDPKMRRVLEEFSAQYGPYLNVALQMKDYVENRDVSGALAYLKGDIDPNVKDLTKDWIPILEILDDTQRIYSDPEQRRAHLDELNRHVAELQNHKNNPYYGAFITSFLDRHGDEFKEVLAIEKELRDVLSKQPIDYGAVLEKLASIDSEKLPSYANNLQQPFTVLNNINELIKEPAKHIEKIDDLLQALEQLDKSNPYYGGLVTQLVGEQGQNLQVLKDLHHAYAEISAIAEEIKSANNDPDKIFKILSEHETEIEQIQHKAKRLLATANTAIKDYPNVESYAKPILETVEPLTDMGLALYKMAALMSADRMLDRENQKLLDDNIALFRESLQKEFGDQKDHPAARIAQKSPEAIKLFMIMAKYEQAHKQGDEKAKQLAYDYYEKEYNKITEPEKIDALADDLKDLSKEVKALQENVSGVQKGPQNSVASVLVGPALKEFKVSEKLDFAQSMMKQSSSLLKDVNIFNKKSKGIGGFFKKVGAAFRIFGKSIRLGVTALNARRKGVIGKNDLLKHAFVPQILKDRLYNKKGFVGAVARLFSGVKKSKPTTVTPLEVKTKKEVEETPKGKAEVEDELDQDVTQRMEQEQKVDAKDKAVAQKAIEAKQGTYESVDVPDEKVALEEEEQAIDLTAEPPAKRPRLDK